MPARADLSGRALWYRAAALLEPLRPWFVWAVERRRMLQFGGAVSALGAGLIALAWYSLRARARGRRRK